MECLPAAGRRVGSSLAMRRRFVLECLSDRDIGMLNLRADGGSQALLSVL
jgi:hypothetical protein